MAKEQSETASAPDPDSPSAAARRKAKRAAGKKPQRTHADRAMASLRAAKRGQREVSDPTERARILLAEANVLALLDVADALSENGLGTRSMTDGEGSADD